ncbi:hypothetical protein, partial [Dolosigranulum pigrum]|uniref:hypothetical protein n=1 Tax=Dolosigranulum pigrum TaxID=29394 RepID=UPI000DBFEA79
PQPKPQPEQPDVPSEEAETKEFLFQYEVDGNRNDAELFQGNRVELASHVLKQVEARHPGYEVEGQVWEEENGYRKLVVKLVKKVEAPKPQPKPQPEQPDVPSEEAETKEFLFQYE